MGEGGWATVGAVVGATVGVSMGVLAGVAAYVGMGAGVGIAGGSKIGAIVGVAVSLQAIPRRARRTRHTANAAGLTRPEGGSVAPPFNQDLSKVSYP